MAYRILYMVAEDVGLKTKGLSGTIELQNDRAVIAGSEPLSLAFKEFEELRIHKQHKIGTLIHLRCAGMSVYLAVPRINLFGVFAVINYWATHRLFDELESRMNTA